MTQTLHKILINGYEVIELFTLPLGMFSEEAQEAINKVLKIFRENFTRKCDRKKNNIELFHRLLCASDPLICTFRKKIHNKKKSNVWCH